jgi:hypothetical protein
VRGRGPVFDFEEVAVTDLRHAGNDNFALLCADHVQRILLTGTEQGVWETLLALLETDGHRVVRAIEGFGSRPDGSATMQSHSKAYDLVVGTAGPSPSHPKVHVLALLSDEPELLPMEFVFPSPNDLAEFPRRVVGLATLSDPLGIRELMVAVHRYAVRGYA